MINRQIAALVLAFLLGFSCISSAQQLETYIQVEDSISVGDTLQYSITLNKDREYDKIIYPDTSAFGEDFEIRRRNHFKISSFKDSVAYGLQFFGTEDVMLPELPVLLISGTDTTTLTTPPELVSFKSALDGEEFKPLKPIFDFAANYWPYLLGLLLLLLLAYAIYRYLNRPEPETKPEPATPAPVFIDPLKELNKTLAELRDDRDITQARDFKSFYIKLGDALRLYFERLYEIPALESTTRELLDDLHRLRVDDDLIQLIKEVMREADMVKFARYTPTVDQAFKALDKAEKFAEKTTVEDKARIKRMKEMFENRHNDTPDKKRENKKSDKMESKMESQGEEV